MENMKSKVQFSLLAGYAESENVIIEIIDREDLHASHA